MSAPTASPSKQAEAQMTKGPPGIPKPPNIEGKSQGSSKNDQFVKNAARQTDTHNKVSFRTPKQAKSPSKKKDDCDQPAAQMIFHSSMAFMTRKLMIAAQSSKDGLLDVNSFAASQGVSRQRLGEIMGILSDLGVVEKVSSKNVFKWKGYDSLMSTSSINESKAQQNRLREDIGDLYREEAILDQWIAIMSKKMPANPAISSSNVAKAIFFPNGYEGPENDQSDVLQQQKSLVVVSAPPESLVCIPKEKEGPDRRLYVGTVRGARKHKLMVPDDPTNPSHNKRKRILHLADGPAYPSRGDEKVRVSTLPTKYDESTNTVTTIGTQKVEKGTSFLSPQMELSFSTSNASFVDSTYDSARTNSHRSRYKKMDTWDQEVDDDHEGISDFFVKDSAGF